MSIFSTQADTYQNSFSNPINPANMNPGWGIDPNLLTPSYTAGYRPQYNGPAPYNQYGRVGFFSGINHIVNPFAPEARWGNTIDNNQAAVEGISSRPFDSVVWAGQRVVAPIAAYGLAFKALGSNGLGGGGPAWGLGKAFGQGVGRGFVGAFGEGATGSLLGRGIIAGAGAATGAVASVAIPYAVGQAMLAGAQRAIFNPYINTRQTARDLRENFSGVTFGDAQGNAVTGGGLGYAESSRIASDITRRGINDMTFSTSEYTKIADFSARSGLLDNANSGQIAQRVKDVAEQIKLIMSIAKDPSIKSAIEELAKLQMAGASITGGSMSTAAKAMSSIGQYAAIAGRSVQNVMNTVGAQGQYLYQANGMTPYLGQMAAANVLSSFGAAERTGMLSKAQLARMGGVEGATQASLTGQINAGQSLYNKMAMYNAYMSGASGRQGFGANQDVTGVVSRFGADFSKDPLGTYGATMLYGRQMLGKQIEERGSLATEDQAVSVLKNLGIARNKQGQYDAAQIMPILKMLGMNDDQAIAFVNQRASETDPRVAAQKIKALNRFNQEQKRSYISQNFLYGGVVGSAARSTMHVGRSITGAFGDVMSELVGVQGKVGDAVQGGADWLQFGATFNNDQVEVKDFDKFFGQAPSSTKSQTLNLVDVEGSLHSKIDGGGAWRAVKNVFDSDVMTQKQSAYIARKINGMAKSGDKNAIEFLNSKDEKSKRAALGKLLATRKDEFGYLGDQLTNAANNSANADTFFKDIASFGTKQFTANEQVSGNINQFEKVLRASTLSTNTGPGSASEDITSLNAIGQAVNVINQTGENTLNQFNVDSILSDPKYADLKKMIGDKSGTEAFNAIQGIYRKSAKNGTQMLGSAAFTAGIKTTGDVTKDKEALKKLIQANGNIAVTQGISSADSISLEDIRTLQSKDDDFLKQRNKIMDALKSNRVDYATAQNTMNSLDNSKSVKDFGDAVEKFDQAVEKINGSSKDTPNSSGPLPGIGFARTFGWNNTGNQRDNGDPRKK